MAGGPPPTSRSPAATRRAPLSRSVNIYWASRLHARRLLPHHRTSKFPKVEPQRRAGVWPRRPCSGCPGCYGGQGVTAAFIPIRQLKNEALKSVQVRQLPVALPLDQRWDVYTDTEQSPEGPCFAGQRLLAPATTQL